MYYHMTVAGLERDLPICPVNQDLSIAGFVIFGDPELTVASVPLVKLAESYGLKDIPHPAFSMQILQEILCMEQRRAQRRQ